MRLSKVCEALLVTEESQGQCENISLEVRNDEFSYQL